MKQTRENMESILRELQGLQIWALNNGIHSFNVDAYVYPLEDEGAGKEGLIKEYGDTEERVLHVCVFRKGDDSPDDQLSVHVYQDHDIADIFRTINNIKAFIGYV